MGRSWAVAGPMIGLAQEVAGPGLMRPGTARPGRAERQIGAGARGRLLRERSSPSPARLTVVASFDEFRAVHNAEHQAAFNRWCVAVGNAVIIVSAVPLLLRRWRSGTAAFLVGGAITGVGH